MRRVLVTNDDGIDAPGLAALAGLVRDAGMVPVVAAPAIDWSGASAALGPLDDPDRVAVESVMLPGLDGVEASGVGAPPALIVMLAMLGGFGDPPHLVVSGVNRGPNTGRSTLHSGTVAAVLVGAKFQRSGLAVSLGDGREAGGGIPEWRWPTATAVAEPLLRWLVTAPPSTLLNLNVPNVGLAEVRGLEQCGLAPVGGVRTTIVGRDATGIDIDLLPTDPSDEDSPMPAGSDSALLRDGFATVTQITPTAAVEVELPVASWSVGRC